MRRHIFAIAALMLCTCDAITAAEQVAAKAPKNLEDVRIEILELKATSEALSVSYEISNESDCDIWICETITREFDFECYVPAGDHRLVVRRRQDVPQECESYEGVFAGTHVRMRPGQSRVERICLPFPVHCATVYAGEVRENAITAASLVMEIGFYYDYDLPEGRLRLERQSPNTNVPDPLSSAGLPLWIRSWRTDTVLRESVWDRDNVFPLGNEYRSEPREHMLRVRFNDLSIPCTYVGPFGFCDTPRERPDLTNCTRIEATYEPSLLEYFFPHADQESLLSTKERQYLQRQKTVTVDRRELIQAFASEINQAKSSWVNLVGSPARSRCYDGDRTLASFTIHEGNRLLMDNGEQFKRLSGFPTLRAFPQSVQAFEARVRCAWNLRKLWNRLRPYEHVENPGTADPICVPGWPRTSEWCDAIVRAYENASLDRRVIMGPFQCPGSEGGKCHYAMNPNCEPNSPADMVLLFETKAGWNQHGGPELFTFDNHDPKGGCVLLNNGVVKFIRTEEELKQLRWK